MLSIANHSRGVVDFDELVLDAQQPRHFTRDRRSAIALGGVVPCGNEGHTRFACQMGLWL